MNTNETKQIDTIDDALRFIDELAKSSVSTPVKTVIDGDDANGGDNKDNNLSPKELLQLKKAEAQKKMDEVAELEKAIADSEENDNDEGSGIESLKKEDVEEKPKKMEKSENNEVLEKSIINLANLLKNQQTENERLGNLEKSINSLSEMIGNLSPGRRSAAHVGILQKSFVGDEGQNGNKKTLSVNSPKQKREIASMLMKSFEADNTNDQLASAITAFESTGYLPESLKKSLEDENDIAILR